MKLVELGRNICNLRRSIGMTQEEAAFELDISTTAYAKIERGETNVSFLRLTQIAELFKVPISNLISSDKQDHFTNNSIVAEIKEIKYELYLLRSLIEKK